MRKRLLTTLLMLLPLVFPSCGIQRYLQRNADQRFQMEANQHVPEGTLVEVSYPVSGPGLQTRRMMVYLPKEYGQDGRRFPVVYLLHGARGNQGSWLVRGQIHRIADEVYASGIAEPAIIVMPNVNQYDDAEDAVNMRRKSAFEAMFEIDGTVESGFCEDVVRYVDSNFLTIPDKDHRAIAGLSIGGMQALYISANNPGAFGYIGLFSPLFGSHIKKSEFSGFYQDIEEKLDQQFADPPRLYLLAVGSGDVLYLATRMICHMLDRKHYPYIYLESSGGHNWGNWRHYLSTFLYAVFNDKAIDS